MGTIVNSSKELAWNAEALIFPVAQENTAELQLVQKKSSEKDKNKLKKKEQGLLTSKRINMKDNKYIRFPLYHLTLFYNM